MRKSSGKDSRVVIFIDDLDRCSPDKALEILESIKLFLGMEGFIFVVGLSHKTVTELITKAYAATGVKGEDYIKKIIQIPIKIPAWSQESILDLVENKIKTNLHEEYTNFLSQNSDMIARVVDYNPRQLKRFVNNVIIAFETFANRDNSTEIKFNDIFLVKILKSEWPDFYTEIVRNQDFLEIVKWILTKPRELKRYFKYLNTYTEEGHAEQKQQRLLLLNKLTERTEGRIDSRHIEILSDFDYESWIFFAHVRDVLFGIKDWKVINTIVNVVEEFSYDLPVGSSKSKESQPASK
ncbi:MAG: P-loop NTPase fold protein [Nitrosopumilaceae archaeon]